MLSSQRVAPRRARARWRGTPVTTTVTLAIDKGLWCPTTAEHLSFDSVLLDVAVRYWERHCSIADHGGGWDNAFCDDDEAIAVTYSPHEGNAVAEKQSELTEVHAVVTVETGKG